MPSLRSLFLSATAGIAIAAGAQHYGDVWQFGDGVGLDFSACDPVVITGNNAGFEGCSSVCDASGQLLFYTNSETVWNQLGQSMPNGYLVGSGGTLSQVLIVRVPQSDSLYYVFTTTIQAQNSGGLRYHVVDMSLQNGMGDVASQDHILYEGVSTEHVAAARHANGSDVWIMAHDYPSNAFLAYLLTSAGITTPPVISNVGPAFTSCNSNINARGELKFSVDGTRVALAGNGVGNGFGPPADSTNLLALFHFDNATGIVSDPLELPTARGDFGLSFSPDGSKLYGTTWKALNFTSGDTNLLYQFDLSSGDPATIIASRTILYAAPIPDSFGSLKLARDGRIYVTSYHRPYLGVINSPDLAGAACGYVHDGLYLNGALSTFGLNNYIEYAGCGSINLGDEDLVPSEDLSLFPNPTDGILHVRWGALEKSVRTIHLFDASGREVMVLDAALGPTFNVSRLSGGHYVATFRDVNGQDLLRRAVVVVP